jgi:hypothetical protein
MKLKTFALIAATSAISVSAYAQTEYNLDVTNTANLSYTSGSDARTAVSNVVTFKVDRKVIFNLTGTNTDQTVAPGDVTTSEYTLTNTSNAPIDYKITAPTSPNVTLIIDDDSTPGISAGDTRVTSSSNPTTTTPIALTTADGGAPSRAIFVEITTPATAVDGDTTAYSLQISAVEPAGSNIGTAGNNIIPTPVTTAWDPAAVQTVVDNSAANADNQGILRTGTGTFTVGAANIALIKSVKILSDPISGTAAANVFPKAIPGAVVQYTLTVKNIGHAPATVQLTDLLSDKFDKLGTITSVEIGGLAPTASQTPTLTADSSTTGFDGLLTVPNVSVSAVPANDTPPEQNTIVTFEVVLK